MEQCSTKAQGKEWIEAGKAVLGIELGSTRIKAVLIGPDSKPLASGGHAWENVLEHGVWTYRLDDVWAGVQDAYSALVRDVKEQYGAALTGLAAMGISAMMHGYLAFDKDGNQLAAFRTWRNTMTEQAAQELTARFGFNIPQRWSIAHLYQNILNKEAYLPQIASLTTLAGYVHRQLTGENVLGVGEASGMFPIDSAACDYDASMVQIFDALTGAEHYPWKLRGILPKVLAAGDAAGTLTAQGAALLDTSGALQPGVQMCPPEGDAGTGMVATNSVAPRTGNVSAGTSIFAMLVLERPLSKVYPEIDMVTTPDGAPVAMVHCNNCTSDLDAWARLFAEVSETFGAQPSKPALYDALYAKALEGDADCGGLLSYNYYAGEPITGLAEGRPLFVRTPESRFTLANFMRAQLYGTLSTLQLGLALLFEQEHVALDTLMGHGGLFKTPLVGQKLMAAATGTPVAVMQTAGEGGAWGIALLAAFAARKTHSAGKNCESLQQYLTETVFAGETGVRILPDAEDEKGFAVYLERYRAGLAVEKAAVAALRG